MKLAKTNKYHIALAMARKGVSIYWDGWLRLVAAAIRTKK